MVLCHQNYCSVSTGTAVDTEVGEIVNGVSLPTTIFRLIVFPDESFSAIEVFPAATPTIKRVLSETSAIAVDKFGWVITL